MDRIAAMTTFVKVVEGGSLSAAARVLGVSLASVSRQVDGLEEHLRTRLLVRTTRRLALTEAGRSYHEEAKRILASIEDAEAALTSKYAVPAGRLTISAPVTLGRFYLAPALPEFLTRYPEVDIDLLLLDRVVNMVEEGIDIAIRVGELEDSSLVARKIGESSRIVCAAPDYLERRGSPRTPGDLGQHDCIIFTLVDGAQVWRFRAPNGELAIPIAGRLRTNSLDASITAAVGGAGLALCPFPLVREHLAAGRLVPLLESFEIAAAPVYALFPHARLMSARVRAFMDYVDEHRLIDDLRGPHPGGEGTPSPGGAPARMDIPLAPAAQPSA